ncbi:hypothetical protein BKA82DRAFT_4014994 [Pisolithus tinctorius]|nr:hypothetical protein BKA82DRAFT_4014994 [Pisolithus tinctorius]
MSHEVYRSWGACTIAYLNFLQTCTMMGSCMVKEKTANNGELGDLPPPEGIVMLGGTTGRTDLLIEMKAIHKIKNIRPARRRAVMLIWYSIGILCKVLVTWKDEERWGCREVESFHTIGPVVTS